MQLSFCLSLFLTLSLSRVYFKTVNSEYTCDIKQCRIWVLPRTSCCEIKFVASKCSHVPWLWWLDTGFLLTSLYWSYRQINVRSLANKVTLSTFFFPSTYLGLSCQFSPLTSHIRIWYNRTSNDWGNK
jgi:hypothetical protein